MVRTRDKAFFLRMHINSRNSDKIFGTKPEFEDKEIQVLQTEMLNTEWLLVECIFVKDLIITIDPPEYD